MHGETDERNKSMMPLPMLHCAEVQMYIYLDKTLRCPCVGSPISFNFFLKSLSPIKLYTSFGSGFRLGVLLTQAKITNYVIDTYQH